MNGISVVGRHLIWPLRGGAGSGAALVLLPAGRVTERDSPEQ
jgi:hypothetical protein